MVGRMIICGLLFSLNVAGQEQETIDSVRSHERTSSLMRRLRQVQQNLDEKARKKVDPHYIELPEKPWTVILRYNENIVDVDYSQSLDFPEQQEHVDWKLCFQPPMASSVGIWVGYRGTGFAYSQSLNKNVGRYFSFSSTGAKYGVNFRYRHFNTREVTFKAKDQIEGKEDQEYERNGNMPSPVWIRSAYLNGYYVFNGYRYSQAAAYNQSVIQRRSAGSFLAGATWYQSSFEYADINNALFILIGNGIHRIKVHQASIGFGYGYNWVPLRGLVVNAMLMPTFSVYSRVKVYKYAFNFELSDGTGEVDDYGDWNPETHTWANGKTHKPITMIKENDNNIAYWDQDDEIDYSMFRFSADLRLGIAYNWKNYFLGFHAQYSNLTYKKDQCKVNIFDAYARLSLGVRL